MAEKELLLGIDLGTSGCKVTLIDTDCNFVGDGYTEYTTYHPNIGWSEQDPADWFPAFMHSFGIALEKGGVCLLYTSPSPRDRQKSRMPSSA